jgi:hypothetical protein
VDENLQKSIKSLPTKVSKLLKTHTARADFVKNVTESHMERVLGIFENAGLEAAKTKPVVKDTVSLSTQTECDAAQIVSGRCDTSTQTDSDVFMPPPRPQPTSPPPPPPPSSSSSCYTPIQLNMKIHPSSLPYTPTVQPEVQEPVLKKRRGRQPKKPKTDTARPTPKAMPIPAQPLQNEPVPLMNTAGNNNIPVPNPLNRQNTPLATSRVPLITPLIHSPVNSTPLSRLNPAVCTSALGNVAGSTGQAVKSRPVRRMLMMMPLPLEESGECAMEDGQDFFS